MSANSRTWRVVSGEQHHWWPKSLSQWWGDGDGMVARLSADGSTLRLPPDKFASIADAHNFTFKGPWRSTFEHEFDAADNSVTDVINHIIGLETSTDLTAGLTDRIRNVEVDTAFCSKVSELVASLLARSPRIRHLAKLVVDRFVSDAAGGGVTSRDPVIAGNVRIAFSDTKRHMAGGVWIFLYSDCAEFIYGDGHFSSFGISGGGRGTCIVPLLPTVAAAYVSLIGL